MQKIIYKYTIAMDDIFVINLPEQAEILTVQVQHGTPQLWALIDPTKQKKEHVFRLAGTGHPIVYNGDEQYNYINSFQLHNGNLIFHLFEILGV